MFAQKQHQAYQRRQRADKRAQIIGEKFSNVWAVGDAEMDKKIAEEAERRKIENSKFLDQRLKQKKDLAAVTREQQKKQVIEKTILLNSDKKKQIEEDEKEALRLKKVEQNLIE